MTSSKSKPGIRNVPSPEGSQAGKGSSVYSRFIPREEINGYAAWDPGAIGGQARKRPGSAAPETEAPPTPDPVALLRAARQAG